MTRAHSLPQTGDSQAAGLGVRLSPCAGTLLSIRPQGQQQGRLMTPPSGLLGLGYVVLQPFCGDPRSPHLALRLLCIPAALSDFPSALSMAQKPASRNSDPGSLGCGHQLLPGPFCRVLGGGSRPLSWSSSVSRLSHNTASGRGALREGEHRLSPPPSMSPL